MKNTKILATYGPSVADSGIVRTLVESGVNLFRVNCSHGGREDFRRAAELIREATSQARFPVGLLFDISGPKLRLVRFTGEWPISEGTELVLTAGETDLVHSRVGVNHPEVVASLQPGHQIFIDDGQFLFDVLSRTDDGVLVRSRTNGVLLGGKGINLPGVKLGIPTITEKDREDIATAVACGADYIALSFVRSPDDVWEARELVQEAGGTLRVIAKLEKREAIDQLEAIMAAADGVMVARGDLGVELPPEELPHLQREITRMANRHHKPVIVATQMLESMRFSPRPTRAEVNDVASAVMDFVDAVMLSAETATGKYPVEAVQMMARVIEATEASLPSPESVMVDRTVTERTPQAIADAVRFVEQKGAAKAVVAFTSSGFTAELISNLFSSLPILALTSDPIVMRALALHRSVYPVQVRQPESFEEIEQIIGSVASEYAGLKAGDTVIVTGGAPFGRTVPTNFMMIATIKNDRGVGRE